MLNTSRKKYRRRTERRVETYAGCVVALISCNGINDTKTWLGTNRHTNARTQVAAHLARIASHGMRNLARYSVS